MSLSDLEASRSQVKSEFPETSKLPFHIKAMNRRARLLCQASSNASVQEISTTDAEGEEWAELRTGLEEMPGTAVERVQDGSVYARRASQQVMSQVADFAAQQVAAQKRKKEVLTPSPQHSTKKGGTGLGP